MTESIKNLLPEVSPMTFGEKLTDEIARITVVAVVFRATDGKFLYQYWQDYNGLVCLLSGGVEREEEKVGALRREITEETGYLDFDILGQLGAELDSHYQKASGERYVKHITPYLVRLNSDKKQLENKEEDEKFENLFGSLKTIREAMVAYEKITNSSLADHEEILARGYAYLSK